MKNMKDLLSYIYIADNVISEELCDKIINEYKNDNSWIAGAVDGELINKSARNVETIGLSRPNTIDLNPTVRAVIDAELYEVSKKCLQKYDEDVAPIFMKKDFGYDLLRYQPGGFYKQHTDSFLENPRTLSCSLALNDEYEGGEFGFFSGEFKKKIPKGSAIIFPSNFMYPHEIYTVTSGTRYSIITWFL